MSYRRIVILLIAGLLWSRSAMAYVDPVNGAMLLQIIASGAAGVALVFRRVIGDCVRRVKGRFNRNKND